MKTIKEKEREKVAPDPMGSRMVGRQCNVGAVCKQPQV